VTVPCYDNKTRFCNFYDNAEKPNEMKIIDSPPGYKKGEY
jgi:hypothetical protein